MKLKCNFKYSCSASNQSLDSESAREVLYASQCINDIGINLCILVCISLYSSSFALMLIKVVALWLS